MAEPGVRVDSVDDRPRHPPRRHPLHRGDPGRLPDARLHRRPFAGDRGLPRPGARPPAAARRRGRRRQDRARQGPRGVARHAGSSASSATRASTSTPPSTSGTTRARCSRSGCSRRAARRSRRPPTTSSAPTSSSAGRCSRRSKSNDGVAPVLLIDEIDRADEEFEAYLLEILSDFQVTVPEIGTIKAETPPRVILTSNRTREVHDALKRRCLYHWIDYPTAQKEYEIVLARVPAAPEQLAREVVAFVHRLREADLTKVPGHRRDARLGRGAARAGCPRARARARRRDARRRPQVRGGHPPGPRRRDPPLSRRGRRRRLTGRGTTTVTDPAIVRSPFGPEIDGRRLLGEAVGFGRSLRAAHLAIDLGAAVDFARALTLVDIADREQVKAAGAAVFVRRRDDRAVYDAAFDRWWRRRGSRFSDEFMPSTHAEDRRRRAPRGGGARAPRRPRPARTTPRWRPTSAASRSRPSEGGRR